MEPSSQLSFSLQSLLKQLSQDELNQFKSLLRCLSLQEELQHIPVTEVEEADGKQLAEILTNRCPSHWVEMVTIRVFDKMNLTDLSERARNELTGITRTPEPKCANLEETQQHPEEKEPDVQTLVITTPQKRKLRCAVELTQVQGEYVTNLEAKEVLKGGNPGKQDKYRSTLKEKVQQIRKKNSWPGASENIHTVTQRYETLIPFCNPKMPRGPFPHTVVLHGPTGIGKTTLAKKCMLDWRQDDLAQTLPIAFYLSCKVLNHKGPCSFAELLAESAPDLQPALPQVLMGTQKLLLVIDAFEELHMPSGVGALVHDLCGDWRTQRPAPVLLGSLLKRKLFPTATLLVTTRPEALKELQLLVEQPLLVEMEGLSELDRRAYFLQHFEGEAQALRAFQLMKSNASLFCIGAAPAVCWMVCTCLRQQMDKGEDPRPTCQTTTSLLLCFLCSRFVPAQGSSPGPRLAAALRTLCLLAAEGTWAQTSAFDGHDLRRLGMHEADLSPFLDRDVLQKGRDCEGCYRFIHLSVQHFLAAALYVLGSEDPQDTGNPGWAIGSVQRLLSKEERLKNPHLTHVGRFLFGLTNEKRARELGTTFGCPVYTEVKQELLECTVSSGENRPLSSVTTTKETLYCLYESQEEELVKEIMAQVTEVSLHLKDTSDMVHASFCLKHCENMQKMWLRVEERVFLENDTAWESEAQTDCLKNIFPVDAYRNFCVVFCGHESLTHLTLQGNDQNDMLPILCEILRHPKCNLQYLRLVTCSATPQQWTHLSSSLRINQSLTCLNLTGSELPEESTKLLGTTLRHPRCFLQRLLENCHLTEACCKELSSALMINQRLTHLCLAKNALGDGGVKLLCEGLSYPDCQLQMLVLWYCNITSSGCNYLSTLLQQNSSLTHLDLGLNHIGISGLKLLCEALKKPTCNLKCLWLWGCAITPFSCEILSSVLSSNQSLVTLDLGQNSLGYSGVKRLCDTLKLQRSSLRTLRLKIDESDPRIQKLLKEIQEYDPQMTIKSDNQDPTNNRPSSHDFIF